MPCKFPVTFSGPPDGFVAKLEQKVQAQNGTFNGDSSSGTFDVPIPFGHIAGTYTILDQQMNIVITHKGLITCGAIRAFVNNNL